MRIEMLLVEQDNFLIIRGRRGPVLLQPRESRGLAIQEGSCRLIGAVLPLEGTEEELATYLSS